MKIVHLIDSLPASGGVQVFLYELIVESLINAPNITHVVGYITPGPWIERFNALGIRTHHVSNKPKNRYQLFLYKDLNHFIEQEKPLLIHALLLQSITYARMISISHNIPILCGIHGNIFDLTGRFHRIINFFTAHKAHYYAVSTTAKNDFLKHAFFKKHSLSVTIINNGIDQKALSNSTHTTPCTRGLYSLPTNAFVIGSIGRLAKDKTYHVLLEAVAKLIATDGRQDPIHLCLVGDGPERPSLEALAYKLGIGKQVHFLGEQIPATPFYSLFDCFALSSPSEGLSLALLEALAFGLPLVSTHPEKNHDVIEDGVNGFIVPINNPMALAQALQKLIKKPELREAMKKNNLEKSKYFTVQEMTAKHIVLWKTIAQ